MSNKVERIKETEEELNLKQAMINKYVMEKDNSERVNSEKIKILNEELDVLNKYIRGKDLTIEELKGKLEESTQNNEIEKGELSAVIEDLTRKLTRFEKTSNLNKQILMSKKED